MKSKEFITESNWNGDPIIGWWLESKPLIMYHGTHKNNVKSILETGLRAPTEGSTAGWVSLAFDPNTAFGYASMGGGENAFVAGFRGAGQKPKVVPPAERAVLVIKFSDGIDDLKHLGYDTKLGGNMSNRDRLTRKELYAAWKKENKPDFQYYALLEIRIPKFLPAKYIIGAMTK